MSAEVPNILVIDDGELGDVCSILDELGLDFARWDKASVPIGPIDPRRLLVTTARYAASLSLTRSSRTRDPVRPVWVAVTDVDSRTQRSLLLQNGFDFLVKRPVHPTAFRMLIRRGLYGGDNHRRGDRVAVGYEIRARMGWWPRKVTLVDLSPRGARLFSDRTYEKGQSLKLELPKGLTGRKPIKVEGVVVRVRSAHFEGGSSDEFSVALRLVRMRAETRQGIGWLLQDLRCGPASIEDGPAGPQNDATRRKRVQYDGTVHVFGDVGSVLVGRDLSVGGMRVDPQPDLDVGDRVRVAIAGQGRAEPVVVGARVARDDGEAGLALVFESFEPGGQQRLRDLVNGLPSIESLQTPENPALVLSQRLPQLLRLPVRRKR